MIQIDSNEKRKPDNDLTYCLEENGREDLLKRIVDIKAEIAGANDELHWHWIAELDDKSFVLIDGWCDYTGWD